MKMGAGPDIDQDDIPFQFPSMIEEPFFLWWGRFDVRRVSPVPELRDKFG